MITEYLAAHPTALVDGDSGAPDSGRAADRRADRARASTGLELPRCLDCGQAKPLPRRVPGGRVCNRCLTRRRPLETCAQCGKLARRAKRDADGQPICGRVQSAHLRPAGPPLRRVRREPHLPDPEADLPRMRASGRTPAARRAALPAAIPTDGERAAVLALRGGHDRAVPRVW